MGVQGRAGGRSVRWACEGRSYVPTSRALVFWCFCFSATAGRLTSGCRGPAGRPDCRRRRRFSSPLSHELLSFPPLPVRHSFSVCLSLFVFLSDSCPSSAAAKLVWFVCLSVCLVAFFSFLKLFLHLAFCFVCPFLR